MSKEDSDGDTLAKAAPYIAPGVAILTGIGLTASGAGAPVGVPLLVGGAVGAANQANKDFGPVSRDTPPVRAMDDSIVAVWKARRALENNDTERAKTLLDGVLSAPTVKEALARAGKEG